MLSKWPIRNKFLFGIGLLLVIVATLSWSGFHGVYAYRSAVRSFRGRADELPLTNQVSKHISDLRVVASEAMGLHGAVDDNGPPDDFDGQSMSADFGDQFQQLRSTLAEYRQHIVTNDSEDERLKDNSEEIETLEKIESAVAQVVEISGRADWMADPESLKRV